MKFNAWQLAVILVILFGAPILAQVFAPGVAAMVVGQVMTLFALFVQILKSEQT